MVTENSNVQETEVPVEGAGVEEVSPPEPSTEPPSVTETEQPEQEQTIDTTQPVAETQTTGEVTRSYSEDEFRSMQSKQDKHITELNKQNKLVEQQLAETRREAESNNLTQQVEVYKEQIRQQLMSEGIDDTSAGRMAEREANTQRELYLAKLANERTFAENQQMSSEINKRSQQARAYELATQNGINYSDLEGISDPVAMERLAKALGRSQKLEQRLQGSTGSQTYGTSQPSSDVAPTDAESIIDRYNSGDPGITTEQANNAARKLGMPDVSY